MYYLLFINCGHCHEHRELECTQQHWTGRTQGRGLEQQELMWTCMKLQKSINLGSRINFCCVAILISKLPSKKKKSEVNIPHDSKANLLQFSKTPSQSRDWQVWHLHHQKMKDSLTKKWDVTICLPFQICFSKINKQTNNKTPRKNPTTPWKNKTKHRID